MPRQSNRRARKSPNRIAKKRIELFSRRKPRTADRLPNSRVISPRSHSGENATRKKSDYAAMIIVIGVGLLVLFSFIVMAWVAAPKAIVDDSPNSTANWCLENYIREVIPSDFEVSLNYSRVARFFGAERFAVNSFVHLEVKWESAYSFSSQEPFLAFVHPGLASSFAFVVNPHTKQFKTLNVDPSPLRFITQLRERQGRLEGETTIPMKNSTSGPFTIAVSMKMDYRHGVLSLEFFQDHDGMVQDRRLLTKRYEIAPIRPMPRMTPILYVANGVKTNNTYPGKLLITYRNIGCNVHQRDSLEGRAVFKQICRSRVPRRFYVCALGENIP
ncbi:uncharacterized protein LOC100908091 [Galendromus occidentalis]|uniref:Uncharacterized protein LOC100908091 n=1 Tax=Galendromus occidentalis TaxID=34638 RepID=A0AAJ6VZ34_9ACAR|nr:uncharacterized protein LOC100908091 [Galendromus occidentalis]